MKPDGRRALEIAQASARAVDRHFESRADGAHPRLGESTKAIHQHPDRDAFDCVRARRWRRDHLVGDLGVFDTDQFRIALASDGAAPSASLHVNVPQPPGV